MAKDIGVTRAEAKEYMERYFSKYDGVRAYQKRIVEQAKEQGYVSTLMGRRRDMPELKDSNRNKRAFGERVALNMPIQGTAADIIKLAMIRVQQRLKAEGLAGRLVLQVHDELIVECPEAEGERIARILEEEMEQVVSLDVKLEAEAHVDTAGRMPIEEGMTLSDAVMAKSYRLVPMDLELIPQIAELERQCFSKPWSEAMLAEELNNLTASFIVALGDNGQVLGYAGMSVVAGEGYIDNVAVRQEYRRQGIAEALLDVFLRFV